MTYRKLTAKFSSKCPHCSEKIEEGEMVWWKKGSKAYHAACETPSEAPPKGVAAAPLGELAQAKKDAVDLVVALQKLIETQYAELSDGSTDEAGVQATVALDAIGMAIIAAPGVASAKSLSEAAQAIAKLCAWVERH